MQNALSFPEVPLHKLRWRCDPGSLTFETTDELDPLEGIIGQERAQKALTLGVEMVKAGYNIYVCGMAGTGKETAVRRVLAAKQNNGALPPRFVLCLSLQESRAFHVAGASCWPGEGIEEGHGEAHCRSQAGYSPGACE